MTLGLIYHTGYGEDIVKKIPLKGQHLKQAMLSVERNSRTISVSQSDSLKSPNNVI